MQDLYTRAQATWKMLDTSVHANDYAGWDPFDGLNSRLLQTLKLDKSRFVRLAWLQLFKRLPLNFRYITGVPKVHNAKALSLFARGYVHDGQPEKAESLLRQMMNLRVSADSWGDAAWGYPFDWQAKAFFVGTDTPNVICTAYALKAIEECEGALASDANVKATYKAAAEFVYTHLARQKATGERYVAYVPTSDAVVYNASLWGCYVLLKGWQAGGDDAWRELAEAAVEFVCAQQMDDGAWRYGEAAHHQFIDGFHTGYNLEALHHIRGLLGTTAYDNVIARGLRYYKDTFFEANGCPKYYHDNTYPIDCHSSAQAVVTLLTVNPDDESRALADKVLGWTLDTMWNEKRGVFFYQKHRYYTNKIPYIRWTQSWMHMALALWLNRQKQAL